MTGITRVSKGPVFSDLNNLRVVTTTSDLYADCFGFTEEEVFAALDEYEMSDKKDEVKQWYDGFTFGEYRGKLNKTWYHLTITNLETESMFENMFAGWFKNQGANYGDFMKALIVGDLEAMNYYMNKVSLATFSYFDVGSGNGQDSEPERFYHGFVLGLIAERADTYGIRSNRESGFRRYRNLIIREKVIKVPNQMEALRIFNYPYQAIEEAVVNAFYHRDYMSFEPVTIEIEPDCINIMNFPGIDRSISEKTIAEGRRFVSRYYRNRRLGEFLKELDLSEGHSSGIPTIQEELEKNGSPRAEFYTDEDRRAMRIRIPIHPAFLEADDEISPSAVS